MNKIIILFLIFIIAGNIQGQNKIDKELLIQDLDVLKINLEAYHTGLYTYTTKEEFEEWYSNTKKSLNNGTSLDFFKEINELNLLIKNGHTSFHINPEQRGNDLLMPSFKIYKDKELFYLKDCDNPQLIGKQIISINKIPIDKVFDNLLKYEERDGNNLTQPSEELVYSFAQKFALEYNSGNQTELEILDNQEVKQIVFDNIPFEGLYAKTDYLFDNGGVDYSIKDSIALLKIETFNSKPLKKANYSSKLKSLFREIRKHNISHLIIDVRNNGGGHTESVEELISYLYGQEFIFYDDVYRLHKTWDTSIMPEIRQYPKNISSWVFKKGDDGYYRASGSDGMKKVKPKKDNFNGKLYILTNGSTLSAAAEFSSFIKQYRKATFIGDESGGNKVQNTSGDWLIIGLPNSKILAFIPYALWKMNVDFENDGHGIKPDYYIQNSIREEINSKDGVMDFTYDLIKKSMANTVYKQEEKNKWKY